jgi:amino acid transporter
MEPTRQNVQFLPTRFSLWDTVCIIVGIIIGVGIFKAPGSIFAMASGPWQALGIWIVGGVLCIVGAFCFAELATTYPRSGGEYVYLTRAFGPWAGFLFAWGQLLIVRTGASIVPLAYVFADYAVKLANVDDKASGFVILYPLVALLPVVVLTVINIIGVRSGKRTQNFLTVLKVLGLVGVLIAGFAWGHWREGGTELRVYEGTITATGSDSLFLHTGDASPPHFFAIDSNTRVTLDGDEQIDDGETKRKLQPDDLKDKRVKVLVQPDEPFRAVRVKATKRTPFGALTLMLILVLWTYAGWHEGSYVAAEVENKRRNLPRALLLGTATVIVLYLLVNAAYIAGLGFETAADSDVVAADVLKRVPGGFGESAMSVLVMLSALGAINGMLCTNARIFAEFGNDHALFAPLGRWNQRFGTLVAALLVQLGVCIATIAAVTWGLGSTKNFERLINGTAPVFWLFFLATGVALFVLRWKDRGIERPFTTPWYPLTPLIYCGFCGLMVVSSVMASLADAAAWLGVLLVGLPLYWWSRHLLPGPLVALGRKEEPKIHSAVGD